MTGRVIAAVFAMALLASPAASAAAPTRTQGELVVALSMPVPGFQIGSVKGTSVVYARGLDIDLARKLARRLGVHRVRFIQIGDARRLLAAGAKPWDVALAQVVPTPARAQRLDLSDPYVRSDQAVLLARGVQRPHTLAELARLQLCAVRGTRGPGVAAERVHPVHRIVLAPDDAGLLRLVQTGKCDAALREAPELGLALAGAARTAYGPVVGRIVTKTAFAVALPKGSPLTPAVDRALRSLRADGTLGRLAKAWLGLNPAALPALPD